MGGLGGREAVASVVGAEVCMLRDLWRCVAVGITSSSKYIHIVAYTQYTHICCTTYLNLQVWEGEEAQGDGANVGSHTDTQSPPKMEVVNAY